MIISSDMQIESTPVNILVIGAEDTLHADLRKYLAKDIYAVSIASDSHTGLEMIQTKNPSLVILDYATPKIDGKSVCEMARLKYNGPILLLTDLDGDTDEPEYLSSGADDFLVKPVEPQRLIFRIKGLLRQSNRITTGNNRLTLTNMTLDLSEQKVTMGRKHIKLTAAEFELLWLLAANAGQVMTRDKICNTLRGFEYNGLDRSVDLRVARLRKKLGDSARNPRLIKSVRSVGYILVQD